jgi:hypothetical protein
LQPSASFRYVWWWIVGYRDSKNNSEKDKDLVATGILGGTGILPVILGRLASRPYSLSYHSVLPSDLIRYGCKTFENCYIGRRRLQEILE